MKTVIQRVSEASVTVDGTVTGEIGHGYMILAGFSEEDDEQTAERMADKIRKLRIFEDENGKMNRSIEDVNGAILSISQFTLYADCRKGNRPSFVNAGDPAHAKALYHHFNSALRSFGIRTEEGIFGADMKVRLLNDGPVTITMDSREVLHGKSNIRK
ncbi:MAG: D-tyrosyl-tRNA(Tyr) deacylase [Solobacterium sp.]|nr:D-tyrosyl-tRNA(Tyr) deacylase [Solobacterium sp.]